MRHHFSLHIIPILLPILLLTGGFAVAQDKQPDLVWERREDLNILLPPSIRVFETNGLLSDGARVRAMYATIDLRDENLKLRAVGSNTRRETTLDTYQHQRAILAINGGYFAYNKSESLIVSDGELVAPGPANFTRGAFGIVKGKPQIVWPYAIHSDLFAFNEPVSVQGGKAPLSARNLTPWHPSQALGGGPVLVKDGKLRDTSLEEGFGESHLKRHPRTAIGYRDDYTLVLMVVDGRQETSAGVTIRELAQIMLATGCRGAVNLDGGGSSAMVAADEVVNVPVDVPNGNRHSLRKNASALVLTEGMPSFSKPVTIIDTDSKNYSETGVWRNTNHANFHGDTPSREAQGSAMNKVVYRFPVAVPDSFQLAAWWTVHEANTTEAIYVLHHGKAVDTLKADQTALAYNGRWYVLGNYYLSPGDFLEVTGRQDQQKLITDAVRLVRFGEIREQPPRGDLRVAVVSDLNSGLGSATYEWQVDSIIRRIPRCWHPDLVLCGGDMVAGMGVSDTAVLASMWTAFDERIAKPLRNAGIPFAFTIGNHDGLRSYPAERKAIAGYWTDPRHQTGLQFVDKTHFPHYYSFKSHGAFFVSWDASSSDITSANLTWLAGQFEAPDAKTAKARFVLGHLPLYSVAQERDSKGNVLDHGDS
ncbi:MAG TPA: phosphodiester glycosidase family protein, partial [Ohtaekwangia sp.]|nr:phosphodiester glycosidase family protein [Ohtaekwangia sp.]